ncbi:MAG TPA: hypothetical protein VLS49_11360 [Usitatibacter sp.]|nr:hypothetical protein [Usitatibacter sp.]
MNGVQTGFVYDGENFVQELNGATATANLVTGGIDELFVRKEGAAASYPITDALGSVIGLTDSSGMLQTQYSYEPYGKATRQLGPNMRTFPTSTEQANRASFEVNNVLVSRRIAAKILKNVPNVSDVRLEGHFGGVNDIRVSFKYFGQDYVVWEPYGDNTRYWIGPRELSTTSRSIEEIQKAFSQYSPPFWRRALAILFGPS